MEKDEIIRMAREAGLSIRGHYDENGSTPQELERFAALVAEPWIKTNKALANEIIELKKQVDISALPIIIEAAVKEAVLAEREKLLKIVLDDTYAMTFQTFGQYRTAIAKFIRESK